MSLSSEKLLLWLQVLGFALTLAGTYPAIQGAFVRMTVENDERPRRIEDFSEQIDGVFARTQMSVYHPRRVRAGDEELVVVKVEHYPDSPQPDCEAPALSAPSLRVTPQPENDAIRAGFVITSATAGRKYLSIVLTCNGKARILADSYVDAYNDVDWLGRITLVMQAIGIPTLIVVFAIHISQQRKRRKHRRRTADHVPTQSA